MNSTRVGHEMNVFTISEITRDIKKTLNQNFDDVWVRGEISGFKRHGPSGHLYFTLKDEAAVLSCAMWKMVASHLRFEPSDGMEVEARGNIDVYARSGRYQLIIRELLPAGQGALLLALEKLRRKLIAEGLFDSDRKKPIPPYPLRIALVTSPTGAAIRDLLNVIQRRWPIGKIVVAPAPVQGEGAAEAIAQRIEQLNDWGWPDLLIVGRGGGSLEDLWAFNEEILVRAVASSKIPIVSAVGHEVDHTLCDEAADLRAPTPSAAAELAVPDHQGVARAIEDLRSRSSISIQRLIEGLVVRIAHAQKSYGLRRATDLLGQHTQERTQLVLRLLRASQAVFQDRRHALEMLVGAYGLRALPERIRETNRQTLQLSQRMEGILQANMRDQTQRVQAMQRQLQALSPRGVLTRGYSMVRRKDGGLVKSYRDVKVGAGLNLEFGQGGATARIETIRPEEEVEDRGT